jgi:hypothetical protein
LKHGSFKHCLFLEDKDPVPEDWKRSKLKELVPSDYWAQMAGYNQIKWYKVYDNKPDDGSFPIKYCHFHNDTLFHSSRLILFIVEVNLLLSCIQVDYGVKQKAKLKYHHKDYNAFAALIGSRLLNYIMVDGNKNPADIVSKHWSYPQVWHLLKPLIFYSGNTQDLVDI